LDLAQFYFFSHEKKNEKPIPYEAGLTINGKKL